MTEEQELITEMSEIFYNLRLYYKWCMNNIKLSSECLMNLHDIQTTLMTGGQLPPTKLLELFRGLLTLIFDDNEANFETASEHFSGLPGYLEVRF